MRPPRIDAHGDLHIPLDCHPRFRWWDGGQSITTTLLEMGAPPEIWARHSRLPYGDAPQPKRTRCCGKCGCDVWWRLRGTKQWHCDDCVPPDQEEHLLERMVAGDDVVEPYEPPPPEPALTVPLLRIEEATPEERKAADPFQNPDETFHLELF